MLKASGTFDFACDTAMCDSRSLCKSPPPVAYIRLAGFHSS